MKKLNSINNYYRILIILIFLILYGCSKEQINNLSMSEVGGWFGMYTNTDDESTYELNIPFEKAINKSFDSELRGHKFRFRARYKGTSPNPGPYKSVKDFINLNLCDIDKPGVCSDLIVIKSSQAESIFKLNDDQAVDVFGVLLETSGIGMPDGGQVAIKAPYNFIRVFIIKQSNSVQPSIQQLSSGKYMNNQSNTKSNGSYVLTKQMVFEAQQKLKDLGYDPGPVDGVMGKRTKNAVNEFQRNNGLNVTNALDKSTLQKLGVN